MFCLGYFSVPDDFKVNPGAVESIAVHWKDPEKVSVILKIALPLACFNSVNHGLYTVIKFMVKM